MADKPLMNIPGWMEAIFESDKISSTASAYRYVPLIYRAVRLRSNALAAVPITIRRGNSEDEIDWPFIDQPHTLIWKTSAALDLTGAAYWEIIRSGAKQVKNVKYRNPFDIVTEYKGRGLYRFKQMSTDAEWYNDLLANYYEMVYFTEFAPDQDVLPGVGSAYAALTDTRLLHYLGIFAEKFFEGGAMPVTLLGIDGGSKEEIERVEGWFSRAATSVKNAFRVLGVRAKSIEPTVLTPPIKDLAMTELHEQARNNVALAFEIPQTMLEDAANFATAIEHRRSFYEDTIRPRGMLIQDILNEQLLKPLGLTFTFEFEEMSIFQEDEAKRAASMVQLINAGFDKQTALEILGYQLDDDQLARVLSTGEKPEDDKDDEKGDNKDKKEPEAKAELRAWRRKALKRVKDGKKPDVVFVSKSIPAALFGAISGALESAESVIDVNAIFDNATVWESYP